MELLLKELVLKEFILQPLAVGIQLEELLNGMDLLESKSWLYVTGICSIEMVLHMPRHLPMKEPMYSLPHYQHSSCHLEIPQVEHLWSYSLLAMVNCLNGLERSLLI